MASIRREVLLNASIHQVWDALLDDLAVRVRRFVQPAGMR